MPNSDPLDKKNLKKELLFLEEIADLDNFEKDHMIGNMNEPEGIVAFK